MFHQSSSSCINHGAMKCAWHFQAAPGANGGSSALVDGIPFRACSSSATCEGYSWCLQCWNVHGWSRPRLSNISAILRCLFNRREKLTCRRLQTNTVKSLFRTVFVQDFVEFVSIMLTKGSVSLIHHLLNPLSLMHLDQVLMCLVKFQKTGVVKPL